MLIETEALPGPETGPTVVTFGPARSTHPPQISLVISSIGRPVELARLLRSLDTDASRTLSIEVIVVDQSSGDPTPTYDLLSQWDFTHPCVYTRSTIGVSHGRNVGFGLARGTFVMFPDDDAWFSDEMLSRAIQYLEATPETEGFCARLCDADGSNSMLRWSPKAQVVTHRNHHRTSIGSVMLFRRSTAATIGGFDESMGPGAEGWFGSCEDADYLLRMIETGATVWYDPESIVHHRDSRNDGGADAEKKSLAYGGGQGHMWRARSMSRIWVLFLLIRRIGGSILMDGRGRSDIGRVQRAWVRGAINGYIGRPPLELQPTVESKGDKPELAPSISEFSKSFRWRIAMSAAGILATFILTAVAARNLPDFELALFFVLLASLSIGPIIGRFGINTKAVQELGAARARGEWDAAVRMARKASIACLFPTLVFGPLIAVFVLAWPAGTEFGIYALLASVILIAESVRLTYSDIFIGLGMPRWGAMLAHQSRAIAVTVMVLVDNALLGNALSLERLLTWTAIAGALLVGIGHVRLWAISSRAIDGAGGLPLVATVKAGVPFLAVDLVAVLIARGDVWLAARTFSEDAAAIYSTASVVAMQIFTPIGLANVALAPVAAGYLALGRGADLQQVIQRIMSGLSAVLLPLILVVILAGDSLLSIAYGDKFGAAQPYLVILLIGNTAFVTMGMSSVVLLMAGRQKLATIISVGWLSIAAPVAVTAAVVGGPRHLAAASSLATFGLVVALALAAWITTGVKVYPTVNAFVELVAELRNRVSKNRVLT